ncbi:MAG: flagellar hook-length control protein FliK [Desulfotomaculum sp.]|nr:flagellar hook-length control protein FliK [Desulfotomaculum sp.]
MSTTQNDDTKEPDLQHSRHSSPSELVYLPLPLKCDYFKSALFYIRQYSKKADENTPENTGLFMKLDTQNLGILWLALFSVPDKGLVVRFIVDNQSICRDILDNLPELKAELKKAGYNEVVTSCLVQPNVRRCEDIDPAAANAEVIKSLIDWEV